MVACAIVDAEGGSLGVFIAVLVGCLVDVLIPELVLRDRSAWSWWWHTLELAGNYLCSLFCHLDLVGAHQCATFLRLPRWAIDKTLISLAKLGILYAFLSLSDLLSWAVSPLRDTNGTATGYLSRISLVSEGYLIGLLGLESCQVILESKLFE